MNGTIKTLTDKGFGFISQEGSDKDLFFHKNELTGTSFESLRVGDAVNFETKETEKGPAAINVSVA